MAKTCFVRLWVPVWIDSGPRRQSGHGVRRRNARVAHWVWERRGSHCERGQEARRRQLPRVDSAGWVSGWMPLEEGEESAGLRHTEGGVGGGR